jgi:ATP-dependent Lon protease
MTASQDDVPEAAPGDVPGSASARPERTGASFPLPEDALILLPVREMVLFPGVIVPIAVGRPRSIAAIQQAIRDERPVGIVMQRDASADDPGPDGLHRIGTQANLLRYMTAPDGSHHVVAQGVQRFRILDLLPGTPFPVARVFRIPDPESHLPEVEGRFLHLQSQAIEAIGLMPQAPQGLADSIRGITSPGALADLSAAYMDIKPEEKQEILETVDVSARMDRVSRLLAQRIEVLRISHEIGQQTRAAFDERQREAVLREQMATIQRQLGEGDEGKAQEIRELGEAIAAAGMPEEVEAQVRKELRRYERMPEAAGEAGMVRTWLDWMIELPWKLPEEKPIEIADARAILDEDHYGLEKIKSRIVEFLAIRKLAPGGKAPILCFVGPPGVGKTSLGQSIARAMSRPFVRVSLGGVHDEAEIRGHRRTYIGALPGNIIQAIRRAGARNCVMMLDEVDKLGRGIQGDPSAALLEVLDPEQNNSFRDAYLGVPFDLSRVVFIATANQLDTIPGPLRDRMEVISLAGYTEDEKLEIARRYLLRRQLEANGLKPEEAEITDAALREIIRGYTREAGVRNLEREIGSVLRNAAVRVADGSATHVAIDAADLTGILGAPRFENEVAMRTSMPGVATGLAWTPVGGDILFIEASLAPGGGRLILTGQLGEVMRESVQAALTLLKSRAAALGIEQALFEKNDIHVHVPAGAIPKDGPSAGVAMFIALRSLLTGRKVRSDTAMTGEISLRGLVLPVGGIKEKVVAAAAAGLERVLLPARNRRDFDDIPRQARERLEFVWLETVDQAADAALETEPSGPAPG